MSRSFPSLAPLILLPLAVAGFCISAYLTLAHWGNKQIACGGLGQCDFVNSSEYASVGGVPVSLLGVMLYAGLAGTSLMWRLRRGEDPWPVLNWGLLLAGAGYAGYLTYVELAILHAICVWCVVSASILALSLLIATAALLSLDYESGARSPQPGRSVASGRRRPREKAGAR